MTKKGRRKDEGREIRRRYREILGRPRLSDAAIDRMRVSVRLVAQAICEHVWGKNAF